MSEHMSGVVLTGTMRTVGQKVDWPEHKEITQ